MTATVGRFLSLSISLRSSSSSGAEESNTAITASQRSRALCAISTPMRSTISSVSRIPAVSSRQMGISPTSTDSSTTSRVVPATEVTMLLSLPEMRFISVDLPTFGLPAITMTAPSRMILPASYVAISRLSTQSASLSTEPIASSESSGTSSSG